MSPEPRLADDECGRLAPLMTALRAEDAAYGETAPSHSLRCATENSTCYIHDQSSSLQRHLRWLIVYLKVFCKLLQPAHDSINDLLLGWARRPLAIVDELLLIAVTEVLGSHTRNHFTRSGYYRTSRTAYIDLPQCRPRRPLQGLL